MILEPITSQSFGNFLKNRTIDFTKSFDWANVRNHIIDILRLAGYNENLSKDIYYGLKAIEEDLNEYIRKINQGFEGESLKTKVNIKIHKLITTENFEFSTLSSRSNLISSYNYKDSDDENEVDCFENLTLKFQSFDIDYAIPFEIWNQKGNTNKAF